MSEVDEPPNKRSAQRKDDQRNRDKARVWLKYWGVKILWPMTAAPAEGNSEPACTIGNPRLREGQEMGDNTVAYDAMKFWMNLYDDRALTCKLTQKLTQKLHGEYEESVLVRMGDNETIVCGDDSPVMAFYYVKAVAKKVWEAGLGGMAVMGEHESEEQLAEHIFRDNIIFVNGEIFAEWIMRDRDRTGSL